MADLSTLQIAIDNLEKRVEATTGILDEVAAQTAPDKIALQLTAAIKSGEFPPGSRLREQTLAERFDVSRGPVREAIQILANVGLVEVASNKGARVTRLNKQTIIEIFDLREMIMGLIHRRAADNAHRMPEMVSMMRECVRLLERTLDGAVPTEYYMRLRRIFGMLVLHMSQNRRANLLADRLEQVISTHHSIMQDMTRRTEAVDRLKQMTQAISEGNGYESEQLVREAVRRAKEDSLALPS